MPPVSLVALADAELFICSALAAQFPSPIRVGTDTPANLGDLPGFIQVVRFGGSDEHLVLDSANVDIDCYAPTRQAAVNLAGLVRSFVLLHLPGYATGGAACQSVTTVSAPRQVPEVNPNVRRISAAYRITIHSIPT